jgi:hypothetical protein
MFVGTVRKVALTLTAGALIACATPVYDTSAVLSGTRSTALNGGILGSGAAYGPAGVGLDFSWLITPTTGGYNYSYTFSDYRGRGNGISHFILELSQSCLTEDSGSLADPNCFKNATVDGTATSSFQFNAWDSTSTGNSNPGLPVTLHGVKIYGGGEAPTTYTFFSDRAPVWGDFYIRGGGNPPNYAYNTGITHHDSANTQWFIARPDTTVSQTPEPASMALFGAGIGLIAIGRRFVRKQTR